MSYNRLLPILKAILNFTLTVFLFYHMPLLALMYLLLVFLFTDKYFLFVCVVFVYDILFNLEQTVIPYLTLVTLMFVVLTKLFNYFIVSNIRKPTSFNYDF